MDKVILKDKKKKILSPVKHDNTLDKVPNPIRSMDNHNIEDYHDYERMFEMDVWKEGASSTQENPGAIDYHIQEIQERINYQVEMLEQDLGDTVRGYNNIQNIRDRVNKIEDYFKDINYLKGQQEHIILQDASSTRSKNMDQVIIKKADYKEDFEKHNMETLKVLLPDKEWTIEDGIQDYSGQFEGIWIAIVQGDDENGFGMLANEPSMDSDYNYGDEIEYKTIDKDSKPVIIQKVDIESLML